MIHIKSVLERVTPFSAAVALLITSTVPTLMLVRQASATPLTNRSLEVTSTVANDDLLRPDGGTYTVGVGGLQPGDPRNGQQVGHKYTFTAGTTQNIAGFTIEYCETAFGFVGAGECDSSTTNGLTGTDPDYDDGFSAASWDGATVQVTSSNGGSPETDTFTVESNGVANFLTLTNAGTLTVAKDDVITIQFTPTATNHFVNPLANYKNNASNGTYFAHIESFATSGNATAAFGAADPTEVDDGTVTNNVTTAIGIYTRVQETLNFSVEGDDVDTDPQVGQPTSSGTGSQCLPLTLGGQLKMGDTNDALSTTVVEKATSFFRLATNSSNGVSVSFSGDTLKSGSNDINPIANTGASAATPGVTEQFGLGINVDTGNGGIALSQLAPQGAYGSAGSDSFAFDTGSVTTPRAIATSTGIVSCDTGRVDYVANIIPDTPAGIYQTKINYIASPRY